MFYKKNRTLCAIFLYISKKSSTFAVAFSAHEMGIANVRGMWRSPVAQRSGGPEVASSNLVIPTKEITTLIRSGYFFC